MLMPQLENSLMSEPLALSWLFLVLAAFCVMVARRSLWTLPLLGAAFGCLVLTRSAGVFAVAFLAVACVVAVVVHRRRCKAFGAALLLTGFAGLLALAALLGNSYVRNGACTLSPL